MTRRRMNRSAHPPARILRVYIEDLVGFSDVFSLDDLSSTLFSQSYVCKTAVNMEIVGRLYIPKIDSRGVFDCPGLALRSTGDHVLLTSSFNTTHSVKLDNLSECRNNQLTICCLWVKLQTTTFSKILIVTQLMLSVPIEITCSY